MIRISLISYLKFLLYVNNALKGLLELLNVLFLNLRNQLMKKKKLLKKNMNFYLVITNISLI